MPNLGYPIQMNYHPNKGIDCLGWAETPLEALQAARNIFANTTFKPERATLDERVVGPFVKTAQDFMDLWADEPWVYRKRVQGGFMPVGKFWSLDGTFT